MFTCSHLVRPINTDACKRSLTTRRCGNGPLVAIELSRLKLIGIEDFVSEINQRGFPAQLKIACAAYVADIEGLPFRLSTDTNANLLGLLNAIIQIGG